MNTITNYDTPNKTIYKKKTIPIYFNVDDHTFKNDIYPLGEPAVLRGVDIGPCTQSWTLQGLAERLGPKPVAIHVSNDPLLNFLNRNFLYRTLPLDELLHRIGRRSELSEDFFLSPTEYYYLRSLGKKPRKEVSNFHRQFPEIADDLVLPSYFPQSSYFSSVLRASSPGLTLWTHYDVMDNLLIQVIGSKKAILFSPRDADKLYLVGDKSEIVDLNSVDNATTYPRLAETTAWEAILEPGDILHIPALWLHNMTALDPGLAVNVFWKSLPKELYVRNDLYGNCDPLPASQAMDQVRKAVQLLSKLPEPFRHFYTTKAASILETNLGND